MATKSSSKKAVKKVARKASKAAKKPHKFPRSAERSTAKPAVLCPADRVLKLYNQGSGKSAKKISKSVRDWFSAEAHRDGWTVVGFLPEVQSQHGAGCMLYNAPAGATSTQLVRILALVDGT